MSRGLLDDSEWGNIYQETPDLDNLGNMVLHLSPDFLSIPFSPLVMLTRILALKINTESVFFNLVFL